MNLSSLIDCIASFTAPDVFNPWRDHDPLDIGDGASARRGRLAAHFSCEPKFLLIGEAPGYQGCHFSGVAFTNESLLLAGAIPRVEQQDRITTRPRPWAEPSASIVWRELFKLGIADATVMWNAFAWHPHKPGEPMSNRAPTRAELLDGLDILEAVCDRFASAQIVAVGRVAEKALTNLRVNFDAAVRHPSMGGAPKFRGGMQELCERAIV